MQNQIIANFEKKHVPAAQLPKFRPGDTVRVQYKLPEGSEPGKFRLQSFEGVVICFKKGTTDATFTVRKIGAGGIGVERVFPVQSPFLDKVEVLASGRVRRARLYYLRDLSGKAARIKSRYIQAPKQVAAVPVSE
jgi:large subunit ribosomal protein L19